jgi:hypothetical protein
MKWKQRCYFYSAAEFLAKKFLKRVGNTGFFLISGTTFIFMLYVRYINCVLSALQFLPCDLFYFKFFFCYRAIFWPIHLIKYLGYT